MANKGVKQTSRRQFAFLVNKIKEYPYLSSSTLCGNNKNNYNQLWREIRDKLNSFGPPFKTTSEWKRVWVDLKARTKRKCHPEALRNQDQYAIRLTEIEKTVADILNLSSIIHPGNDGTTTLSSEAIDTTIPSSEIIDATRLSSESVDGVFEKYEEEISVYDHNSAESSMDFDATRDSPSDGAKSCKPADEYVALLHQQTINQEHISGVLERIANSLENFLEVTRQKRPNSESVNEYLL